MLQLQDLMNHIKINSIDGICYSLKTMYKDMHEMKKWSTVVGSQGQPLYVFDEERSTAFNSSQHGGCIKNGGRLPDRPWKPKWMVRWTGNGFEVKGSGRGQCQLGSSAPSSGRIWVHVVCSRHLLWSQLVRAVLRGALVLIAAAT